MGLIVNRRVVMGRDTSREIGGGKCVLKDGTCGRESPKSYRGLINPKCGGVGGGGRRPKLYIGEGELTSKGKVSGGNHVEEKEGCEMQPQRWILREDPYGGGGPKPYGEVQRGHP